MVTQYRNKSIEREIISESDPEAAILILCLASLIENLLPPNLEDLISYCSKGKLGSVCGRLQGMS